MTETGVAVEEPGAQESASARFVCPACDEADFRVLLRASDRLCACTTQVFSVVECAACRLIRVYPRPPLEELHRFYPEAYWRAPEDAPGPLMERWRGVALRGPVRFIREALVQPGPVLEVGCGAGYVLEALQREGVPVAGLDISPAAAAAARRNGVPAACADLEAAPFAPETFAAVLMLQLLEHLPLPDRYLDAARKLLRPGGRLFVQVPNAASWQFLLFGENWSGLNVPRHLVNFRPAHLESLLEGCGFEVLRRKHFSLRDNPAGVAASFAPALDPVVRRLRQREETRRGRVCRDLTWLAIATAALPFALLESACGAGATFMVEARKR